MLLETKGSLFLTGPPYILAHCISKDCKMGAGIAADFNLKYPGMKSYCLSRNPQVGEAVFFDPPNGRPPVFNLITKAAYYNKPTYTSLRSALEDMKNQCLSRDIRHVAMPQIGCGLDRLSWPRVRALIVDVFQDTDIEIVVKTL